MRIFLFVLFSLCFLLRGAEYPDCVPEDWKSEPVYEYESRELMPGVVYAHFHFKKIHNGLPLSIYFVIVDWDKARVRMKIGTAVPGSLQTVREIVEKDKKELVVSVNGAYFTFKPPMTYFYLKSDGVLFHAREGQKDLFADALVFNKDEFPKILRCTPEVLKEYRNVIQGYQLGKDGINPRAGKEKRTDHTPYTAVGLDPERKRLILWVNDGRSKRNSPGIGFDEIATWLIRLGSKDVLAIDGGGSSTFVLPDPKTGELAVMNHPSDNLLFNHRGERAIQNCLYIVKTDRRATP